MHWGTFKTNATEFYLEPKYKIEQARLEHGKTDEGEDRLKFYTISIGETLEGISPKKWLDVNNGINQVIL